MAAVASLALSVMALPEARIGVILDVVILAAIAASRSGWIPARA